MTKPHAYSEVIPSQGMKHWNRVPRPHNYEMWQARGQGVFILFWFGLLGGRFEKRLTEVAEEKRDPVTDFGED